MNWLEFFSKAIDSLAWPVAIIGIAFLFKLQLQALIGRIRSLKGAGLEAEFGQEAKMALVEAKEAIPEPDFAESTSLDQAAEPSNQGTLDTAAPATEREADQPTLDDAAGPRPVTLRGKLPDWYWELKEQDARPSIVVEQAWREVAVALHRLIAAKKVALKPRSANSPIAWLTALEKGQVITRSVAEVVRVLYSLRNKVVLKADFEPAVPSAMNFALAAAKVAGHLDAQLESSPPDDANG